MIPAVIGTVAPSNIFGELDKPQCIHIPGELAGVLAVRTSISVASGTVVFLQRKSVNCHG